MFYYDDIIIIILLVRVLLVMMMNRIPRGNNREKKNDFKILNFISTAITMISSSTISLATAYVPSGLKKQPKNKRS